MLRYFAARPFAGLQLPHERALSFAAVMAAAEARAFLHAAALPAHAQPLCAELKESLFW